MIAGWWAWGGGSKWTGTVWAPNGAISIGSGYGTTHYSGALWSGTSVTIKSGVTIVHAPFDLCTPPNVDLGPDMTVCVDEPAITLTASTAGGQGPFSFQWSDGQSGASIQVDPTSTTTYSVIVTDLSSGSVCSGTDAVTVTVVVS